MKKIYLIATVTALIAGLATYFFANQIAASSKLSDVAKCDVAIVTQEIPANTVITPEMVSVQQIPVELSVSNLTDEWAGTVDTIVGRMTVVKLAAGEQILRKDTVIIGGSSTPIEGEEEDNSRLSFELKKGEYAFTTDISQTDATDYYMREGDYVYIYISSESETGVISVSPLFGEGDMVKVLKLSAYSDNKQKKASGAEVETYSSITLLLDQAQLETMMTARVAQSNLMYVLVPQQEVVEAGGQIVTSSRAPAVTAPTTAA